MEANCVCYLSLALQRSENEQSAACGVFLCEGNNSSSHVASASFCLKEEGSYFSRLLFVSVEKEKRAAKAPAVPQFSVTTVEMIQSYPTAYHDIALDFKSICSTIRHI